MDIRKNKELAFDLVLIFFVIILSLIWSANLGKDLNWDLLNYHVYNGSLFFDDRLDRDYFASNIQSYLNPVLYVPFYLLVNSNLEDFHIALILSFVHSINFILVWFIIKLRFSSMALRASAMLLTLATPLYWQLVGSSFGDLIISIPTLLSVISLLLFEKTCHIKWVVVCGILIGIAVGLKLSAVVYTPPIFLFAFFIIKDVKKVLLSLGMFFFGFFVVYFWWGLKLYLNFENPFFPLFNDVFCSKHFPCEKIMLDRYIPDGFFEFFLFPVEIAYGYSWTYSEVPAPDIRLLVFFVVILFLAFRKRGSLISLLVLMFYFFWVSTSGNGRYGFPLLFLLGVGIVEAVNLFLDEIKIVYMSVLFFLINFVLNQIGSVDGYHRVPWQGQWINFDIPTNISGEKALFISSVAPSISFITNYINPKSSFVTVFGQFSLNYNSKYGEILRDKINNENIIKGLVYIGVNKTEFDINVLSKIYDSRFIGLGLKLDKVQTCQLIRIKTDNDIYDVFTSCSLKFDKETLLKYTSATAEARKVFEDAELKCDEKLSPKSSAIVKYEGGWYRNYMNTDYSLVYAGNKLWIKGNRKISLKLIGEKYDEVVKYNENFFDFCK